MWSVDRFGDNRGTDFVQNWTWELSGFSATGELPGVSVSAELLSKQPSPISAALLPWRHSSLSLHWKYIARLQHLTVYIPSLAVVYYIWSIIYGKSYYSARNVSFQQQEKLGTLGHILSGYKLSQMHTNYHKGRRAGLLYQACRTLQEWCKYRWFTALYQQIDLFQ